MQKTDITQDRKRLLEILRENAYFQEKITLSSGKESDYYIDARRVTLSPEGAFLCARIILDIVDTEAVDALGGPTMGADPIVGALGAFSFISSRPINTFIIRKKPKPYGKQQQLEGPLLKENARVILVDDVATTGKSFIQSLEVLKAMNIRVLQAVCIVDRQEGAKELLAKEGLELVSIFTPADFK